MTRVIDVHVQASDDIWAVGHYVINSGPEYGSYALTMHYDGAQWNMVSTPITTNPVGEHSAALEDADFLAPDLGYAAGSYKGSSSQSSDNFVLQWDGQQWWQLPCPGVSAFGAQGFLLESVKAIDSDNVWFGGQWTDTTQRASMIHFDGSTFTVHLLPLADGIATGAHRIRAIDASGPNDVWAAGSAGGLTVAVGRNYVAHWDGSSWQYMLTPNPGFSEILRDIAVIAPDDVWVSGRYKIVDGSDIITLPLFLHWDGSSWTQHAAPAFGDDLVALASDDIYAVEGRQLSHWDGMTWTLIDELPAGPSNLNGIDAIGPCDLVAVGSDQFSTQNETSLVARVGVFATAGDLDGNGAVDVFDLFALLEAWGTCSGCPEDLDGNGIVDAFDLFELLANWG